MHTIITHPGGAHKDDLLAVCVLVSIHGCPVVRREPTAAELVDPSCAVVDIGGSHDPALANFDHHHFARDHAPTSALSLVLDHLGLYQDALKFCDWLETAEWFDSRGPNKTAEWLGVPRRAISRLNSPIDVTLIRRFAQASRIEAHEPLHDARAQIDFVAKHAQRWSLQTDDGVIETLFLPSLIRAASCVKRRPPSTRTERPARLRHARSRAAG